MPIDHPAPIEKSLHTWKDLLAKTILFQQVPQPQDRNHIRSSFDDQVDATNATHEGYLNEVILFAGLTREYHCWIR
jgi:hypothetical protein